MAWDLVESGISPQGYSALLSSALSQGIPQLHQQQPIIGSDTLQMLASAVLGQKPPLTDADRSTSLGKLGMALLKPRQPGQSVASSIGEAVDTGLTTADTLRQRAQAEQVQRAQIANTLATADLQRRQIEQGMEIARVNFPLQFAKLQTEYTTAMAEGRIKDAEAIRAQYRLFNMPQDVETERRLAQARVENERAQAQGRTAEAGLRDAQAAEIRRVTAEGGKEKPVQQKFQNPDTGEVMIVTTMGGKTYIEQVTPGLPEDRARDKATKEFDSKQKTLSWSQRWATTSDARNQAIAKRTQELMQTRRAWVGEPMPKMAPKPGGAAPTDGVGGAADTPAAEPTAEADTTVPVKDQRREAALKKTTTYDTAFSLAEKQYGLPPGILKRVAMTESSLKPGEVNDADGGGKSYGLMQINSIHGIDPELLMEPSANITKGAELLAKYYKQTGSWEEALRKYKGARTDEGRKRVQGDIKFILRGIQTAQAATTGETRKVVKGSDGKLVFAETAPGVGEEPVQSIYEPTSGGYLAP